MPRSNPADHRILVVDDDRDVRDAVTESLMFEGYAVAGAESGQAAWRHLKAYGPPSLILLDLLMPDMDGWELHGAIKMDPKVAATPVVLMSSLDRVHVSASLLGAAGYLVKPVRHDKLIQTVAQHCRPVAVPSLP